MNVAGLEIFLTDSVDKIFKKGHYYIQYKMFFVHYKRRIS